MSDTEFEDNIFKETRQGIIFKPQSKILRTPTTYKQLTSVDKIDIENSRTLIDKGLYSPNRVNLE